MSVIFSFFHDHMLLLVTWIMRVIKVNGVDMLQYSIELSIYSTSSVEYDESETKPMEGQNGERKVQLQISLLLQRHRQLH